MVSKINPAARAPSRSAASGRVPPVPSSRSRAVAPAPSASPSRSAARAAPSEINPAPSASPSRSAPHATPSVRDRIGPLSRDSLLTGLSLLLLLCVPLLDARLTLAFSIALLFLGSFLIRMPIRTYLFTGALAALAAIALQAVFSGRAPTPFILILSALLLLFLLILTLRTRRREEVLQDERTLKLHYAATSYSWWTTFLWLVLAFWLDFSGYMSWTLGGYFLSTLLVMLLSKSFFSYYLGRRADL